MDKQKEKLFSEWDTYLAPALSQVEGMIHNYQLSNWRCRLKLRTGVGTCLNNLRGDLLKKIMYLRVGRNDRNLAMGSLGTLWDTQPAARNVGNKK